jgi:Arc/MetJ family transcription regulator
VVELSPNIANKMRRVPCLPAVAGLISRMDTPIPLELVYSDFMARTNININETLIRKAQKLTRLKTKREIVDRALELLVRSEDRKSILHYHGSGIWKGNYKLARRNRV